MRHLFLGLNGEKKGRARLANASNNDYNYDVLTTLTAY